MKTRKESKGTGNLVLAVRVSLLFFFTGSLAACAQDRLAITNPETGIKVIVLNKNYPLLKVLLPGQPEDERCIEIEFPEHVTGINKQSAKVEHVYLVTRAEENRRTLPTWKANGDTLVYETMLNNSINLVAHAILNKEGLSYFYRLTNHSAITYENIQAVTCVKLYSVFADTMLERTYVHHPDGFDLLASETPARLTMSMRQWLPCRYLVPYTWAVSPVRKEKGEDAITRYHKSRKVDMPFIATISRDQKWIAATYTKETVNVWTNPERTCQHADPAVNLMPGETKELKLKTFIIKGSLEKLLGVIKSGE
jgi:hypothetical protein